MRGSGRLSAAFCAKASRSGIGGGGVGARFGTGAGFDAAVFDVAVFAVEGGGVNRFFAGGEERKREEVRRFSTIVAIGVCYRL